MTISGLENGKWIATPSLSCLFTRDFLFDDFSLMGSGSIRFSWSPLQSLLGATRLCIWFDILMVQERYAVKCESMSGLWMQSVATGIAAMIPLMHLKPLGQILDCNWVEGYIKHLQAIHQCLDPFSEAKPPGKSECSGGSMCALFIHYEAFQKSFKLWVVGCLNLHTSGASVASPWNLTLTRGPSSALQSPLALIHLPCTVDCQSR